MTDLQPDIDPDEETCVQGSHCCCCFAPGERCCDCGGVPIRSGEVLDFIDTFAGQENEAEEVRDFVQAAARHVHEGKTREALANDALMSSFVEWSTAEYPAGE